MRVGKSILLAISLLFYGLQGHTATFPTKMPSIDFNTSALDKIINRIVFASKYEINTKLKYIDPWEGIAPEPGQVKKTNQQEPIGNEGNLSTNSGILTGNTMQVDMGELGLILLIIISLALYAINRPSKDESSKGNEYLNEKESDVKYEDIHQAKIEAEQGNVTAQTVLGKMYYDGQTTPQDFKQAYIWFSVATAMGSLLAKELRDQAIEKLNPESIEVAQSQATKLFESLASKKAQEDQELDLTKITTEGKEHHTIPHKVTSSSEKEASVQENMNTPEQKIFYKTLLKGDYSLAMTFWIYFLLFNIVLHFLIQSIESLPVLVIGFCIAIWWQISTIIGTIRSAIKYKGPKVWSVMAIAITAVNGIFACVWGWVLAYSIL